MVPYLEELIGWWSVNTSIKSIKRYIVHPIDINDQSKDTLIYLYDRGMIMFNDIVLIAVKKRLFKVLWYVLNGVDILYINRAFRFAYENNDLRVCKWVCNYIIPNCCDNIVRPLDIHKILEILINERNKILCEMKKEGDLYKQITLNSRQISLKMMINSVYGAS